MRVNDTTQLRFLRLTANLSNKFDPAVVEFCGVNIVGAEVVDRIAKVSSLHVIGRQIF